MAVQIVMNYSGDSRHCFSLDDAQARARKGWRQPVGARAGSSNRVTTATQFLEHFFAMLPLRIPRVREGAARESYR